MVESSTYQTCNESQIHWIFESRAWFHSTGVRGITLSPYSIMAGFHPACPPLWIELLSPPPQYQYLPVTVSVGTKPVTSRLGVSEML